MTLPKEPKKRTPVRGRRLDWSALPDDYTDLLEVIEDVSALAETCLATAAENLRRASLEDYRRKEALVRAVRAFCDANMISVEAPVTVPKMLSSSQSRHGRP